MSDFVIMLDQTSYRVGDTVTGRIEFDNVDDQKLSKVTAVKVKVQMRVSGSGNTELKVVLDQVLHEGPVVDRVLHFDAVISPEGPMTFAGRYVKIKWEVVVTLDIPWAIDPKQNLSFEVGPRAAKGQL